MGDKKKVVIAGNTSWYLANFRLTLMKRLLKENYEVIAYAPLDKYTRNLEESGIRFAPMYIDNNGTNPLRDFFLLLQMYRFLKKEAPLVYLGYTVKPNVYGGIVCKLLNIPTVLNIAGLGTVFVKNTWITGIVKKLYALGLKKSKKVFFQNKDDKDLFLKLGLVKSTQTELLPGSGVNINHFKPMQNEYKKESDRFIFLLLGRLLWDKGVGEYVEAGKLLKSSHKNVEFWVLGFLQATNPNGISRQQLNDWVSEGLIRYLGDSDDVRTVISQADCVVLPSYYREGVPRSLLEAASMGKPIITTDSVGCREVVDDGRTGYLCKPRDSYELAKSMIKILTLSSEKRHQMGLRAREKMRYEFNEEYVINKYLDAIHDISFSK